MNEKNKRPVDEKKVKFRRNILGIKNESKSWITVVTAVSFFLTAFLLFFTKDIIKDINIPLAFLILLVIVAINIIFDIIGVAVTAADEAPFHAMASRKLYGARQSIRLVRNANKVAAVCSDIVGDICSIISGTASAFIIIRITKNIVNTEMTLAGLVISGIVAAITVGGKAFGKTIAIKNSNYIVYKVSVVIKFLTGKTYFFKKKRMKAR